MINIIRNYFEPLRLALHFSFKSGAKWVVIKFVLITIQALLPLAGLYILKLLIDGLTTLPPDAGEEYYETALVHVLMLGGIGVLTSIISSFSEIVNEKQRFLLDDYIAEVVNSKSLSLDLAYYENPKYLDSFQRAQSEASSRPGAVLNSWTGLVKNSISLIGIATYLVYLNWLIAVVLLLAAVPAFIIKIKFSESMFVWQQKRTSKERESGYLRSLMTGAGNVKEMRVFDMGNKILQTFRSIRKLLRDERMRIIRVRTFQASFAKIGEIAAITGALIYLAKNVVNGTLTIGDLVMYHQAFQKGQSYLQGTLRQIAGLYEHRKFLTNLTHFLSLKPNLPKIVDGKPVPSLTTSSIRFDNVGFTYLGQELPAISNITFEIPPGELITMIGQNGSGKSTLIKLLCQLYRPSVGSILIGDVDLSNIDVRDWQDEITVVFQDFNKYNFTLEQNVVMPNLEKVVDMDRLRAVTRISGVDQFLDKLPQGYNSLLGRAFLGGIELSQGQWQRIAIARALYRNSKLLILDEPTSALDPEMEYDLFNFLRKETQYRTIVIISHRITAAKLSDKVLLLNEGEMVGFGNHDDLLAGNMKYRKLYEQQASLLTQAEIGD